MAWIRTFLSISRNSNLKSYFSTSRVHQQLTNCIRLGNTSVVLVCAFAPKNKALKVKIVVFLEKRPLEEKVIKAAISSSVTQKMTKVALLIIMHHAPACRPLTFGRTGRGDNKTEKESYINCTCNKVVIGDNGGLEKVFPSKCTVKGKL